MLLQIKCCLEFLSASFNWAIEPVIGVRFLVLSKAIAVREGLLANIALEPLPDVVFAVPSQLFLV